MVDEESVVEMHQTILARLQAENSIGASLPLDRKPPFIESYLPVVPLPMFISDEATLRAYELMQENFDDEEFFRACKLGRRHDEDIFWRIWVKRWLARIYVMLWEIVRTQGDSELDLTDGIPADLMTTTRCLTNYGRTIAVGDLDWFGESIGLSDEEIEYLKATKDQQLENEREAGWTWERYEKTFHLDKLGEDAEDLDPTSPSFKERIVKLVARRLGYTADELGQSLNEVTVDELMDAVFGVADTLQQDQD